MAAAAATQCSPRRVPTQSLLRVRISPLRAAVRGAVEDAGLGTDVPSARGRGVGQHRRRPAHAGSGADAHRLGAADVEPGSQNPCPPRRVGDIQDGHSQHRGEQQGHDEPAHPPPTYALTPLGWLANPPGRKPRRTTTTPTTPKQALGCHWPDGADVPVVPVEPFKPVPAGPLPPVPPSPTMASVGGVATQASPPAPPTSPVLRSHTTSQPPGRF
jgi:hypothetical protein